MGLETEYGFTVEGVDVADLVTEARRLVQNGPPGAPWDYRDESPMHDLRGFRATRLRTNPADDDIERRSRAPRPRTPREDHVDRALANGARLYHDHGHPEYSTPECRSLFDLVAHDRAGARIVGECARNYRERTGHEVSVYKNNVDYHGMSYGCHENFLISRELPFGQLVYGLLPFLVTRVIYAGAGKVGAEDGSEGVTYQLAQRADFFDELMSVDTLHRRPLINTRDEPHAQRERWRRLHLICGDANLSEFATALKVGATALTLGALEAGYGPPGRLRDPLRALRELSRNPNGPWLVEFDDGTTVPAIEIQRAYLGAARELAAGRDEETDWILKEWERVLDDLEADPRGAADRLDWAAKRELLASFMEAEDLNWEDDLELLRSLELEYHHLHPERGLFWPLEGGGAVRRLTADDAIERAMRAAPRETRASVRALCLRRFHVESLSWGCVRVRHDGRIRELDLRTCVDGDFTRVDDELGPDATVDDVLEWLSDAHGRTLA